MSIIDDLDIDQYPDPYKQKENKMFTIKEIVKRESKVSNNTGKDYVQFVFKTTDGRQISGFGDEINAAWKAGDIIQDDVAVIEQNGKWYNMKMLVKPEKKKPQANMSGTSIEVIKLINDLHAKVDMIDSKLAKLVNQSQGIQEDLPI